MFLLATDALNTVPAEVSHWKSTRTERSDKTSTVTKRLWLRKASHSMLHAMMQPLGKHGRRVLNGSSTTNVFETEERRQRRSSTLAEAVGEICWHGAVKAAVNQNAQPEPVQCTVHWRVEATVAELHHLINTAKKLTLLNESRTTPLSTRNWRISVTICVSPRAILTPTLSFLPLCTANTNTIDQSTGHCQNLSHY